MKKNIEWYKITKNAIWVLLCLPLGAHAVSLIAIDDLYQVPYFDPVIVEPFGVMENDMLDGNNAGEEGATVTLVSGVSKGVLTCPGVGPGLCSDGSFEYQYSAGFNGTDSFTYQATFAGITSPVATVTLSACTGGPVYSCWKLSAYLAKLAELGYTHLYEGFEGTAWDIARTPVIAPGVDSKGVRWTSNHIATNGITTGTGGRTGLYSGFDPSHGFASCQLTTCSTTVCDVDFPPPECLFHDGLSGSVIGSGAFHAVGAYIDSNTGGGAKIGIRLDGTTEVTFSNRPSYNEFFGVIDDRPAGFTQFEVRELDGKVGQRELIFFDDFYIVTDNTITADGDLAPRGQPDGVINSADYLVALRIILQQTTPTADEIKHGDLYPAAGGDGEITLAD